jgi:hypothetical protein
MNRGCTRSIGVHPHASALAVVSGGYPSHPFIPHQGVKSHNGKGPTPR